MPHSEALRELDALLQGAAGTPPLGKTRETFAEVYELLSTDGNVEKAKEVLMRLVRANLLAVNVAIVGHAERVLAFL